MFFTVKDLRDKTVYINPDYVSMVSLEKQWCDGKMKTEEVTMITADRELVATKEEIERVVEKIEIAKSIHR